jgi:hypothetical protein
LVTYPGLVLNVSDYNTSKERVRVVTGRDEYKILERQLNPTIAHSISTNCRFGTMNAGRNCTRAEAMMLGMDVDRRAKVGDFVMVFELSNRGSYEVAWFNGIFAVTEMWKAGPYAILVKGSDNGRLGPSSVILAGIIDYMVINWKGS